MSSIRDQLQPAIDQAIRLHQAGRVAEAERIYRQVLAQDPANPDALHLLGLIAHHAGQPKPAIHLMSAAIHEAPKVPLYHMNLAKAYRAIGAEDEGIASARRAVELAPAWPEALIELSACLRTAGKLDEAERTARDALGRQPNHPEALSALANALADLDRTDEAIASYEAALAARPGWGEAINNLGEAYRKLSRFDEAEKYLREAIRLTPEIGNPHLNLAMILLARGDFEHGWAEYEWRWHQIGVHPPAFREPEWDGGNLNGRSILLFAEQGLGDTIQFVRYAPLLRDTRGAGKIIVECERPLVSLIKTVDGVDEVIAKGDVRPSFDVRCALASMPYRFKTALETVPNRMPYVEFDRERAARWREELKLSDGVLNVGIVWAGSAVHKNDRNRSCRLNDFASLADVADVRLISLQVGPSSQHLREATFPITDAAPHIRDFIDSAALMSQLDLIVSVDSSPAHLAGALARPVWTIHPYIADFRWMLDRADSPWYPTMRLFRQPRPGDWKSVMEHVTRELRPLAETAGRRRRGETP